MYNEKLNESCTNDFREAVSGKNVLFVGNAASLFSSEMHGELIDSYDFVLRFGKGFPDPFYSDYLGKRTDAWFFGPSRAGMYKKFKQAPWKIYTPSQLKVYDGSEDCLLNKSMLDGDFQIYRDFFMMGPASSVVQLNKRVNGVQSEQARLSQGIQAIDWMVNVVKSQQKLTLIGFDFFGKPFNYTYKNESRPDIPKDHPTTSWHCPLVSKNYDTNPHAFSLDGETTNEKKYILSLPGIEHIKMPEVDLDKMDEVVKRLRGKTSTVTGKL
jgi:hypothetical protein